MDPTSNLSPLGGVALALAAILTWALPRRLALVPLLAVTCLIPLGQDLVVFGLHFRLFRALLLVCMFRVILRRETALFKMTRLDKVFLAWALVSVVFGSLAKPSMELLQNKLGAAYNALGCYFFFRCVVVDMDDVVSNLRALAWLSVPVAALMLVEQQTGHNLLYVFGGVPDIAVERGERLRCQGAFRHPILAGTYGAAQFPLCLALWCYGRQYRRVAILGAVSSVLIVLTSASSGPVLSLMAAVGGLAFWRWRGYLRLVRWGAVVTLVVLALVMKAPVWYIMAKINVLSSSTGWHRAWLIDQAVNHFHEWWLFGTTYTAHWAPGGLVLAADPDNMDITNQYVAEGVKGGILELVLFVWIIVLCFKIVGRWVQAHAALFRGDAILVWSLGVVLFVHCVSFMSISYFDQTVVLWFWLLAVIAVVGPVPASSVVAPEPQWVHGVEDREPA
jgi:hypothetical protein